MILLLGCLVIARAETRVEPEPRVGHESVVQLVDADDLPRSGATVRVVHRPGLVGERELAIGITDGRGRVRWTPGEPGVARLKAGDEVVGLVIGGGGIPLDTALLLALLAGAASAGLVLGLRPRRHRPLAPARRP